MSLLCRFIGHKTSPAYEVCVLVSRRRRVRKLFRRFCERCQAVGRWSRNRAPEWIVCVRCGQEGHRSHQCKRKVS